MFDILVLSVVGISTAFAALRGGLRELSTLIALAVAGGLTLLLLEPLLNLTGQTGSFFGMVFIAGFLIAVFFIAAHIACHMGLKRMPLEGNAKLYDRVGGGVFGFARGLVLIGLGYLGYSYYLDEARQPEEVKTAMTRPVAAGVANWFESFTPEEAYIENDLDDAADDGLDASVSGYDRSDRNGLSEIVTTVTTTDPLIEATAEGAAEGTQGDTIDSDSVGDDSDEESDGLTTDDISDILIEDDTQ